MEKVRVFEVGPRDGLQNEKHLVSVEDKVQLVDALSGCGFDKIEVSSFVSPKWVPQMATSAEVMEGIERRSGVTYAGLTPNMKGLERAIDAKCDEVAVFTAASETFCQKNTNCSISESLERIKPLIVEAKAVGLPVRGYISCVTHCPYEGVLNFQQTADLTEKLLALGVYEVSLGDTIGQAQPDHIDQLLAKVLKIADASKLAGHFHDTNKRALDNVKVSLGAGLRCFDSSIAGLGGCPFAPGAKGNLSTNALDMALKNWGFDSGLDTNLLGNAEKLALQIVGR
ncbi:MAG: hydroxymethylglutaryl-CoA lyase [Alphaproteobacteria bacterium]